MIPIKLSQLPQFSGDSSGSYIVINDSSNSTTYIVNKESFFTASLYGTASFSVTSSYVEASSIDGLSLSQIVSGSATASISPGIFSVNTNTSISGSLQVVQGITGSLSTNSTIGNNPVVDLYTAIALSVAL